MSREKAREPRGRVLVGANTFNLYITFPFVRSKDDGHTLEIIIQTALYNTLSRAYNRSIPSNPKMYAMERECVFLNYA